MKIKWLKKIGLALLCFLVLWIMYHQLMIRFESKALDGPFEYVEVGDKQLHLYDSIIGEKTIVMLPGYGTGSPIHDFMPLVKFLEKDYRVIVIEPLGYGYSQTTKKERTIENILEEYREALKKTEAKPPYVLLPHSISGIYSMYYAGMYPDEIEAIIGDDIVVPSFLEYDKEIAPSWSRYLMSFTGVTRLSSIIMPNMITPDMMDAAYSPSEQDIIRKLTAKTFINETVLNEWENYESNAEKVLKLTVDPSIPIMIFSSHSKDAEENEYVKTQKQTVEQQDIGKHIKMGGPHYLHWIYSEEMTKQMKSFLNSLDK